MLEKLKFLWPPVAEGGDPSKQSRSRLRRGALLAVATLLVLALDFWRHPDLVEDRVTEETLSANRLVNGDVIEIGRYRVHDLRISLGRIEDEVYLRKLGTTANGIAITAYSALDGDRLSIGSLGNSVIRTMAQSEADRIRSLIENFPEFTAGKVQTHKVGIPHAQGPLSHIDAVFIMRAKRGNDSAAKEALKSGLIAIMDQSGKHSVNGLILPTLTITPEESTSPSFDDFFRLFFDAAKESKTPGRIDISFYEGWPVAKLEAATAAFNSHWRASTQESEGTLGGLHRFQFRVLVAGLALCFLASSYFITLGAKSAAILAFSYAAMLLGAFKTFESFTDLGQGAKNGALLVVTVVLSIAYIHIATWSAKDLTQKGHEDAGA